MQADQGLREALRETAEVLADGLDLGDLATLLRTGTELAERADDLTGPEKRDLAIRFVDEVVAKHLTESNPALRKLVTDIDLPGPDWLEATLWDPILCQVAPGIARAAIHALLPKLLDLLVDATLGRLKVNDDGDDA